MSGTMKKRRQILVLAFLLVSLCVPTAIFGQESGAVPDRQTPQEHARRWLQTKITYSCVNTPIETVLMELAEQAKVDIIKAPTVTGNVTVKLTDIPLEEALTNILAAHNYTYIATDNMIRVVPVPEAALLTEQPITRIYHVTYADANEVAAALAGFVSERGRVALNKGTSHIVVTDLESRIKAIDKFIEQIDSVTPQIVVEVRIYDITTSEGFELGTEWSAGRNAPLKTTKHTITKLDTAQPTPATEETTYSRYRTDTTEGIVTETRDDDSTTTTTTVVPPVTRTDNATETFTTRRMNPFVGGSFNPQSGGALHFSLLDDAVDLDLVISALSRQVGAKLLANPRVLVLDNETANFEILREVPYTVLSNNGRERDLTHTVYKDVGIRLKVTPHLTRDGTLRLHIMPEFGDIVGIDHLGAPTVDVRRADTIAMVGNGQTIAIGGLRKTKTSKTVSKVPLLGDVPIVGGLFRSESESESINELVVFITSRIAGRAALSETEQKQFGLTEALGPQMSAIEAERQTTEMMLQMLKQKNQK